jgi:histidyl-tRNA synthetase
MRYTGRVERIEPKTPSGFRDLLPADAAARQALMERIAAVFARYAYVPIDTPALERLEVLTGGDEGFSKQLYRARITEDDEPLGLRFDLTVPLARYVAAHADKLVFPFKRWHMGNVWRGEHAQAGRYRQFVQCDADIVGSAEIAADAEIIALVYAVFAELGLADKVSLRISDRRIMGGLPEFLGFPPERLPAVLRAVDKQDKQGWEAVAAELTDKCGLDAQQTDGIQELLALKMPDAAELLSAADEYLKFTPQSHTGIEALRQLTQHLDALEVPRTAWAVDLSIARGLGYYTGMVFETSLAGAPQYGSVCSGGRYDGLVERFSPLKLSGVGMSVGLDRLFSALGELGLASGTAPVASLAVLTFEPAAHEACLTLAARARAQGIATELYLGHEDTLKGQLAWAVKRGFPYVAIMGEREHARGVVQLKDMVKRTQEELSVGEVATKLAMR